ncbi:GIY-YIG nuclease family protein [Ornatilinea apprima]|uniref:GIY-YIG nuclease family protein n=1 Tax=Ornatilinea apprima TaxID=1134406 RepID=UPI001364C894|nr:GIY-YIG nuclease family protein [Ornatilinea apprima]
MNLPPARGSYVLLFENPADANLRVGKLGWVNFPAGYYVYFGSAKGSGGIRGRVGRHLRSEKKAHWHIDAVLQGMRVIAVGYAEGEEPYECIWSRRASEERGWDVPAAGLGASDCRAGCPAHLFFCGEKVIVLEDLDARMTVMFLLSNL